MSRSTVLLILIAIFVVALSLRLYGLDNQSVWYDELFETNSFHERFFNNKSPIRSNAPPLNSVFVYPMTQLFPRSDFALRLMPFIFGVMTIPFFFFLGRRLFNEKVALIASYILAISPFHIWHSQDARMYALKWMLVIISLLLFLRSLEKPTRGNFIGYVVSTTASLYTHQLAVFLLIFQGLYILLCLRRFKLQFFKWVGAFSAVVILYLPWIAHSLISLKGRIAGIPRETDFKAILYTIHTYFAGYSVGPSIRELHLERSLAVIQPYFAVISLYMIVYSSLFLLGLLSMRQERAKLLFMLLFFTVPISGMIILNYTMPNITYNVRYTAIAFFACVLFVAKGIDWLSRINNKLLGRILAVIVVIAITGLSAYSYYNYQFTLKYHKADFREAAEYINKEKAIGDSVLCLINSGEIERYSKGGFQCLRSLISTINDKDRFDATMMALVNGKTRLWLVLSSEWYIDNADRVKGWLDSHYEEIKHLHKGLNEIANIRIYSYKLATTTSNNP